MTAIFHLWRTRLARPFSGLTSAALSSVALISDFCRSLSPRRLLAATILLAFTSSVASTLAVFPHELSYFNEIAGGPLNGHAHLLGGNLDWGQDLLELKRFHDAHPEIRPLHITYTSFVKPETAGLIPETASRVAPSARPSGYRTISVNHLHGGRRGGDTATDYVSPGRFRFVTRVGYSSHCVFRVHNPDASR